MTRNERIRAYADAVVGAPDPWACANRYLQGLEHYETEVPASLFACADPIEDLRWMDDGGSIAYQTKEK